MSHPAVSRVGALIVFAAALGCGGIENDEPQAGEPAAFTILGRWKGPLDLTYRVEATGEQPLLGPAMREAAEIWNASGVVSLRPASEGESADVTFSFQFGKHGPCAPFGGHEALAHAGPMEPPSYVHFDGERDWTGKGESGYSLAEAAAHELGHVLGLGHSPDPAALLFPVPGPERRRLGFNDRAALHSLYGGGADAPGDIAIAPGEGGPAAAVLRRVAPEACTDVGVLDTDGDGDEEILVWHTDVEGYGRLMIYHFESGPRLARTVGSIPGVSLPGAPHITGTTADGERLLVSVLADGRWLARTFDAEGLPQVRPPGRPLELGDWKDTDGDGHWEDPRPAGTLERAFEWSADLDGDGIPERVTRR